MLRSITRARDGRALVVLRQAIGISISERQLMRLLIDRQDDFRRRPVAAGTVSSTFPACRRIRRGCENLGRSHGAAGRSAARASRTVMRSFPQRSQVIRRNHEGKALNGWSRASAAVGSGSVP